MAATNSTEPDSEPDEDLAEDLAEDLDDDTPDDEPEPYQGAGPDIGLDDDDDRAEIKPFTLWTRDGQNRKTPHPMQARPDEIDYATLVAFTRRGGSEFDRINAMHHGLRKVICDDDGIPSNEELRVVVKRNNRWVDATKLRADDQPAIDELRYMIGDNTAWDTPDEALEHAINKGSSLRRFDHITDPTTAGRVPNKAIEDIIRYLLTGGSGARPTKSSRASSRSRRTKKTRSGAG